MKPPFAFLRVLVIAGAFASVASAQVTAPNYEECRLWSVFPAGARQGETVEVEFLAHSGGVENAREILIDGPPGITVRDVKNRSSTIAQATFVIAPDAVPGRRCVRVRSDRSGLTNMIYFTVGRLPEVTETEPNNEPSSASVVSLPVVVNGRVNPKADFDCFAFDLKKGQRLTAVVLAHAIDSHGQYKNYGFVDAVLELLDARGRVVAEAGDSLGLDPLIEYIAPDAGRYTARVRLEAYEGFPQAVYRLVLGEVPLVTSLFPAGGQRGTTVEVELNGPNVPPSTRQNVTVPNEAFPSQSVLFDAANAADFELPFVRGNHPERLEVEPNGTREQATPLELPMTANGRFGESGDDDWYRVRLVAGQPISLETTAQRFLRSPVDTLIEVFDATGKKLAENDDGFRIDYISIYDFRVMDSRLVFTPPTTADYFVRVTDQSGGSGLRSVYRLTIAPAVPDFDLLMFPDSVPIWGPGSTAALVVKVERRDELHGDVELSVEGLPRGWIGSTNVSRGPKSPVPQTYPYLYTLLTITAPSDAKIGDVVPFRVVGRASVNGKSVERIARPLTLYFSSDVGLFRLTPNARAVVAASQTPWLTTPVSSLRVPPNGTVEIPVQMHGSGSFASLDLTADLCTSGVATALVPPRPVTVKNGQAVLSFSLPAQIAPGRYGIVAGFRWRSDIRIGMPGPCTPIITLDVEPPATAKP